MKKRVNKSMSENWKRTYVDYDKDKGEDSVSKMMKRVENKIEKFPVLGNPFAKLVIMIDMVRNYIKGSYRDVPKGLIFLAGLAIVYFLSFVDVLPDMIPIVGYIDDAIVLSIVLLILDKELRKFKRWRDN